YALNSDTTTSTFTSLSLHDALPILSREPALSRIDIVPLFETLEDLEQAPLVVRSLLGDRIWQRHLAARGRHQEVMLGYSDSAKRSEEHTSELQSRFDLVCRLLLEKK